MMSPDRDAAFYREQAALQRTVASETALPSVRDRCERAANAWDGMADRSDRAARAWFARLAQAAGPAPQADE